MRIGPVTGWGKRSCPAILDLAIFRLPTRLETKEPRLPIMPTPATSIGSTFSGDEPVRRLPRDGAPALHRKPIPRPVLVPADQFAHVEALED